MDESVSGVCELFHCHNWVVLYGSNSCVSMYVCNTMYMNFNAIYRICTNGFAAILGPTFIRYT